jgi:hypothetical protein
MKAGIGVKFGLRHDVAIHAMISLAILINRQKVLFLQLTFVTCLKQCKFFWQFAGFRSFHMLITFRQAKR